MSDSIETESTPVDVATDYWLTRQEVADRIKIPVKTLAQWSTLKKGPRFAKLGKYARYKLSDVIAWEEAQFGDFRVAS